MQKKLHPGALLSHKFESKKLKQVCTLRNLHKNNTEPIRYGLLAEYFFYQQKLAEESVTNVCGRKLTFARYVNLKLRRTSAYHLQPFHLFGVQIYAVHVARISSYDNLEIF